MGEIASDVEVKFCSLFTDKPEKLLSKKIIQKAVIYTKSILKGDTDSGIINGMRSKISMQL
jgi:hypothetical protein